MRFRSQIRGEAWRACSSSSLFKGLNAIACSPRDTVLDVQHDS